MSGDLEGHTNTNLEEKRLSEANFPGRGALLCQHGQGSPDSAVYLLGSRMVTLLTGLYLYALNYPFFKGIILFQESISLMDEIFHIKTNGCM